jgi:hypothetical protein
MKKIESAPSKQIYYEHAHKNMIQRLLEYQTP